MAKHIEHVSPDRAAIAPYNFVELPERLVAAPTDHKGDHSNYIGHTGVIHCTLTAETPLYTRTALPLDLARALDKAKNGWSDLSDADKESYAAFFHHGDGVPRIPGSSLRGMLRSLVEIGGYGKVDRVSRIGVVHRIISKDNVGTTYRNRIMRNVSEEGSKKHYFIPNVRGGYVEKVGHGWQIRPAVETDGTTFARVSNDDVDFSSLSRWGTIRAAYHIYIQTNSYEFRPLGDDDFIFIKRAAVTSFRPGATENFAPAALLRGGRMGTKKSEAVIYAPDTMGVPLPVPRDLELAYRDQITKEQKSILGNEGVLQNGHPVFYLMEGGNLTFFGHTAMMRLPYKRGPLDLIPAYARDQQTIDIADTLFGFVRGSRQETNQARAGRLTFHDGLATAGTVQTAALNPRILSGPKTTTFQHYLVQESANPNDFRSYDDSLERTELRGIKLYWHQRHADRRSIAATPAPVNSARSQYTIIRPLDAGAQFTFAIRFESLNNVELGALLWALQLGDGETRLKLGMGKPLGMGSVRVVINTVEISSRATRYTTLFDEDGNWATGAHNADATQQAAWVAAFQSYVLAGLEISGSFDDLARIAQLRAMLSWNGAPEPSQIRYMEIERQIGSGSIPAAKRAAANAQRKGKQTVNEYIDRPVLPTPLDVLRRSGEERHLLRAKPQESIELPNQSGQLAAQPAAVAPAAMSTPRVAIDTRTHGVVVEVAIGQREGYLEGSDDRKYRYLLTDIRDGTLQEADLVLFIPTKRKVQGKNVNWAEDISFVRRR